MPARPCQARRHWTPSSTSYSAKPATAQWRPVSIGATADGSPPRRRATAQCARRVHSLCQQRLNCLEHGRSKPWARGQPGDRILVGATNGAVILASIAAGRAGGCTGGAIPGDVTRVVCPVALESMIDAHVKLISTTLAPGQRAAWINPARGHRRSGRALWQPPTLLMLAKPLASVLVDVQALQCDVLKSAGRNTCAGREHGAAV